jgi:LPS-assembly lipoprotein
MDKPMHSIKRRALLALLPGIAAAAMLSACGFQLRGSDNSTNLPFKTIYLGFPDNSPLGTELRRYIRADGGTRVVGDAKEAQAIVEDLSETREEAILSLNSQGRIRELALFYRFKFRVKAPDGKEILAPTEIVLKRNMSFNESEVLAKESEKALLYRDMQSDLVQQILRRLAVLKPA